MSTEICDVLMAVAKKESLELPNGLATRIAATSGDKSIAQLSSNMPMKHMDAYVLAICTLSSIANHVHPEISSWYLPLIGTIIQITTLIITPRKSCLIA